MGVMVLDASGRLKRTLGPTPDTILTSTATGTQNDWAPALNGNTCIEWSGAADATFTGLAGGVTGQRVTVKNTGTNVAFFSHAGAGSAAANRFANTVTSGLTPIGAGGWITYLFDGTNWKLVAHTQGAPVVPAYNSADFFGSASMTWTVASGDVQGHAYVLNGNLLTVFCSVATTTVGGTPDYYLEVAFPYTASATLVVLGGRINDNGTEYVGDIIVVSGTSYVRVEKQNVAVYALSTNNTTIQFVQVIPVS